MATRQPQYEVIEGQITNLIIHPANVHFLKTIKREQQIAGAVAVGQAMAEQAGAVFSAQAAMDDGDPVESFTMELAGETVAGSFWKSSFREGDEIRVVGAKVDGYFRAKAIVDYKTRSIWIQPHCERGSRAQGKVVVKRAAVASLALSLFAPLMSWYLEEPLWLSSATVGCAILMIWGVMVLWSWPDYMSFSTEMNAVATALGWENPAETDLFKTTRAARKAGKPELPMGVYYY